jgi:hypothetical protein
MLHSRPDETFDNKGEGMLGGRANRLDETASNRRFPWSSPVQALTLVLVTIVAYYHAFFDVPRATS